MDAKISHSGLLARSPEGHAARGMQIKGNEDLWVEIQANTFRNWVNENLPSSMRVADLSQDLCSGVRLCALVEALQGRPIKPSWNKRPANQHHYLENVTAALNAIEQDGVKLVNIGNVDIVNGNLKLILGLIWSLIVRYQIGRSKFPPRKLMLAWLQAVLPECRVTNLTTDWNSGVLLSALVDYCQPGLFPHWKSLSKNDSVENCRRAMSIAQKDLGIPAVLEPEYLASPWLDELSGMTYLSYFMKPGSPGFHATLRWVNSRLNRPIKNFTSDWNDGRAISEVIKSLGGSAPAPEKLRTDPSHWEDNLNQALNAGRKLGVQPILSAKDMADKNVEHLGVMAYAAHFQWIPERPPLHDLIVVRLESTSGRVGEPTYFSVELLDRELSYSALSAEIRAPDNRLHPVKLKNGNGSFVPQRVGMHEILVLYNGEEVSNAHYFRVLPPMVEVAPPGMAPCALGSIVQVLVNATGAPKTEDIRVTAYSPHNRALKCPLTTVDGTNTASFKPDEAGEWRIEITYQGKQIQGGPFTCSVFDPNGVHVSGLEAALPLVPHILEIDTHSVGVPGELHADVVHDKKSVHSRIERIGKSGFQYRLHFTPKQAGKHRVYFYFNGYDVKGSPFMMRVGTQKGKKSSSSSPVTSSYRQSPTFGAHSGSRLNTPSPVSNFHSSNSVTANKSSLRQSSSPVYGERSGSAEHHKMAGSPVFLTDAKHSVSSDYHHKASEKTSFLGDSRQVSGSVDYHKSSNSPSGPSGSSGFLGEGRHVSSSEYHQKSSFLNETRHGMSSSSGDHYRLSPGDKRILSNSPNSAGPVDYHKSLNSPSAFLGDGRHVSSEYHQKTSEKSSFLGDSRQVTSGGSMDYHKSSNSPIGHSGPSGLLGEGRHVSTSEYQKSSFSNETRHGITSSSGDHYRLSPGDKRISSSSPNNLSSDYHKKSLAEKRLSANSPSSFLTDPKHSSSYSAAEKTNFLSESRHVTNSGSSMDYHKMSSAEKRISAGSPSSFLGENRQTSPIDYHRLSPGERRISSSPSNFLGETKHSASSSEFHKLSTAEKRITSSASPSFMDRSRLSPSFNSSELRKSSERRVYQSTSPNFGKTDPEYLKIEGSRSPVQGVNFSGTRFERHVADTKTYSGGYDENDGVDTTPIIKVSAVSDRTSSRRDSWDAIAKTRNILSHRSLESVANLADSQLDAELRHENKYSEEHSSYAVRDQSYGYQGQGQGQVQSPRPVGGRGGGATAVKVQPVPDGVLGQPVEFEIDGSGAGSGDLEILVEGGRVTSSVRSLGGQRFKAAFTPHQALPHRVDIRFNGETVPGSPWHVNIMSASSLSVLGESTRLVPANTSAVFEIITSSTLAPDELTVHVISPSKRIVPARVLPGNRSGVQQVEFVPTEVGTHVVDVAIGGEKLVSGPLIAKVYDAGLIQVADVSGGVVGQPVQFRVDASQAGEGQLEISINEGEVPNHVQVVGGGRCLVSFTPDQAKPHLIDIKFNGETVRGCPFVCSVADTSRVTLSLSHLELIPVNQPSSFHMGVSGGGAAELAVAVRGPSGELPVKVTGDIHAGFTAEFTPSQVGGHQISVDYNGRPVQGTPFLAKAFDATRVTVGAVARGTVGRPVTFSVDASEAGEGNLEITISARGLNIPTQVHPQGNARFAVSFVPAEACDHVVNVAFNKRPVVGCPLIVGVAGGGTGSSVTLPGPGPVHRASTLLINHPGRLEDIEVNVEGPGGQAVPTQVQPLGNGQFRAEFVPRAVGEHRIAVSVNDAPTVGSPYSAKVYDVQAIKVKEAPSGVVGKPVTFLVETSQAGPGNLEVTVNGGRVPTSAQAQGAHTYAISFTPREATPHTVDLRFNGQDVPGSPFKCVVAPAARILAPETLDKVSVGRPCQFAVESPTAPTVEILGPARRSLQVQVTPQIANPGKFDISFTPLDVGDHSVEVRLNNGGGHVEGSPFLIKAYDAHRVSVTDITDGTVGKPVSFSINASQAGAGNLEIIVAVNGRNVPNFVQSEGNARFKVNFKPTEAATHSLSVRFNGQAVPGSPFACKVSPGNTQPRVPVTGNGIELAAVGSPAEIKMEGLSGVEPQIVITAPTGKLLPPKQSLLGDALTANFTPEVVGRHSVAILISDQHVIGSPFSCNVYDVSKVIVSGLPGRKDLNRSMSDLSVRDHGTAEVGRAVTFSVDAAQAGEGTLELVVSTQQTTVKAEVVACARGLYDVTFIPQTSEDHFVNITFNDTPVLGSPFMCPVAEATQYVQIGSIAAIDLPSESHHLEITDPNGQNLTYSLKKLRAEFPVAQIGTYRLHIMRGNEIVAARTTHVFDSSKIEVISAPEAVCHRPAVIGINLKNAGPGKLSATVKVGNKDIAHSVRQNPSNPNLWEVVFHPVNAAPHRITLSFNGVPKPGVLEVPVRAPGTEPWAGGLGLYQARVGKVTAFTIDTLGRPAREFDVVVSGPTGSALPVRCYQTKTGRLQAEFTAQDVGPHRVEVLHQARPLAGSPFTCQAFDAELIRLTEIPQDQVNVGERILFTLNAREAGLAELEITATSPLGQTLPLQIVTLDEFTQQISFLPTVPGLYQLTLLYGGVPVQGSPLGFAVGPLGPQPPPRAVGPGLEAGQVGERTSFTVSCIIQPRVQIEAPEGPIDLHTQCPKPGEYIISYTPLWVGIYDIMISCGPQPLAGSPFHPAIIDPSSVHIVGGWSPHLDDHHRLKLPARLSFDVTHAGPGTLECIISGRKFSPFGDPSLKSSGEKKYSTEKPMAPKIVQVEVEGLGPGEHDMTLMFGNVILQGAPTKSVSAGDQVVLTGRGLAQAQCGEPSVFNIDGSRAGLGNPEVTLQGAESSLPVPVMLSLAGDKMWRAQYTITTPGTYLLSVLWAGRPVKGCPLTVEARGGADASKVLCSGEGLRQGVVGREIRSWIDTRRAGPGELTAHCTGPRKVAYCELYDHGDATFTLNVKPQEAGRHALTIKYAGQHVPGSPFALRVAGAPDASKVRVYGPGIEHGVLATFQSRFICDTRGAGAGQLTVRVRGPKGAFRVEMQRESQKDRTILCKYDPTEPGDYRVEVKWAGELVPGSPFPVMIFDTQEELRRYLNSL